VLKYARHVVYHDPVLAVVGAAVAMVAVVEVVVEVVEVVMVAAVVARVRHQRLCGRRRGQRRQ
jgi:hypothetical protein